MYQKMRSPRRQSCRLSFEPLEDRCLPHGGITTHALANLAPMGEHSRLHGGQAPSQGRLVLSQFFEVGNQALGPSTPARIIVILPTGTRPTTGLVPVETGPVSQPMAPEDAGAVAAILAADNRTPLPEATVAPDQVILAALEAARKAAVLASSMTFFHGQASSITPPAKVGMLAPLALDNTSPKLPEPSNPGAGGPQQEQPQPQQPPGSEPSPSEPALTPLGADLLKVLTLDTAAWEQALEAITAPLREEGVTGVLHWLGLATLLLSAGMAAEAVRRKSAKRLAIALSEPLIRWDFYREERS